MQALSGVTGAALFSQVPDQKPGESLVTRLSEVGGGRSSPDWVRSAMNETRAQMKRRLVVGIEYNG